MWLSEGTSPQEEGTVRLKAPGHGGLWVSEMHLQARVAAAGEGGRVPGATRAQTAELRGSGGRGGSSEGNGSHSKGWGRSAAAPDSDVKGLKRWQWTQRAEGDTGRHPGLWPCPEEQRGRQLGLVGS